MLVIKQISFVCCSLVNSCSESGNREIEYYIRLGKF